MEKKTFVIAVILFTAIFTARAQVGTWSGKLELQGTTLALIFHLDEENPTLDSPDQGIKGIPIDVERRDAGKIFIRIPSLGASYEGQWVIKRIVGTFTQMNISLPLMLAPGENRPRRPQTPAGPFPYTTEDVSFANGDVVLNGTLVRPEAYSRNTPALLMVTGSGQQNRDEEIFEHKPFAVIADAFARAGIATLRYDDRGFAEYSGNIYDCTTEDFKEDALAGVELLRKHFDKVGIIGHSEGGTIALMLAANKEADFIISLAGMVISGAETLIWQNRNALLSAGYPDNIVDSYCKMIDEAFSSRISGRPMPKSDHADLPDELKQNYTAVLSQIQMPYMTYFLSLDMRSELNKITCPVLALNGTKDTQVDHVANLNALMEGLPSNPANIIESVTGLNHLFQHCTTGSVNEYRNIEETIAPEVMQKTANWIWTLMY